MPLLQTRAATWSWATWRSCWRCKYISTAPQSPDLFTLLAPAADPGGHLVMGDLAELLLAMPEAEHADET